MQRAYMRCPVGPLGPVHLGYVRAGQAGKRDLYRFRACALRRRRKSWEVFTLLIQAVVAVSVEALVFILIGHSCSEGCGFDSHCRPDSFLRFHYRPIMYGEVDSLVFSWSWT